MGLVDGTGLVVWNDCLFDPAQPMLAECKWVDAAIRERGGRIIWNEVGRPYGVPSDRYATSSGNTYSGRSTVWYQWGRFLRGETPEAANPANGVLASDHTKGIASDTNAPTLFDMQLRRDKFRDVGHIQTIPTETWHHAKRLAALVDVSAYAGEIAPPPAAPTDEEILMAGIEDLIGRIDLLITTVATADDAVKTATIVRSYADEAKGRVTTALIYPDGRAVKLSERDDVTNAVLAHVIVYGLKPTNDKESDARNRFGSQVNPDQWRAFWKTYPGEKFGFNEEGI